MLKINENNIINDVVSFSGGVAVCTPNYISSQIIPNADKPAPPLTLLEVATSIAVSSWAAASAQGTFLPALERRSHPSKPPAPPVRNNLLPRLGRERR